MNYLKIWTDFAEVMEPLNDGERGRLFTAMLKYAETGELPHLTGNERYIWPTAKQQIDRAREECDRLRKNGSRGGRPKKPTETNENQPEPTESQKDNDKGNDDGNGRDRNTGEDEDHREDNSRGRAREAAGRAVITMSNGMPVPDLRTRPGESKLAGIAMYWLREAYPGSYIPPHWPDQIARAAEEFEISDVMMRRAICRAAEAGAASPVAYAIEVMRDMAESGDGSVLDWIKRREGAGY